MASNKRSLNHEMALMQKYIQLMEKMLQSGEMLNKGQISAITQNAKTFASVANVNKIQETSLKKAVIRDKMDAKELVTKEKMQKVNEHLIRLRSSLRLTEEREHGAQVRRNIILRDTNEKFSTSLSFAKNALTGGFGFSAALGTTVKKIADTTKKFNNIQRTSEALAKAQVAYRESLTDVSVAKMGGDKDKIQQAENERDELLKLLDSKLSDAADSQIGGGMAENKKTKPIFAKLSKLGEFLGKKAVPIGLGLGVAGVIMSVIVKAFSASPLFAAMMKMMKFMVTLILMPIGTFFGALLRPILIMLLRKFIIPFYSTYMPVLMKLGTSIGEWMALLTPEGIKDELAKLSPFYNEEDYLDEKKIDYSDVELTNDKTTEQTPIPEGYTGFAVFDDMIDWFNNRNKDKEENIYDATSGEINTSSMIPISLFAAILKQWDYEIDYLKKILKLDDGDDGADGEKGQYPIDERDIFYPTMTGGKGDETEGERQVREDKEALDRDNLMKSDQERTNIEMAEAAKEKASKEAEKHAKNAAWMELNRSVLDMNKLMETNGIITEAIPKVMSQEMTNFASYGMEGKMEKGGAIHDAGISMSQDEIDKKNEGYQGYGGVNSTLDSAGRSSQSVMDKYNAYLAGVVPAADGFDGMVNKPTMFLAGEAGAEHVKVTPNGQSSGSNITVNIQNMNGSDNDLRKLKKTILEVIQESSANRGRL